MLVSVSNIIFEGRKTPNLQLKRKNIKNLTKKQNELVENCKVLEENFKEMGLAWQKVSALPPEHPDSTKISKLWQAKFNLQYSFINGSYNEYKTARKAFAEIAVRDYSLLKFVEDPIIIRGSVPIYSKIGRNMLKNAFLDKFRIKTSAEKQLEELTKNEQKQTAMKNSLGLK